MEEGLTDIAQFADVPPDGQPHGVFDWDADQRAWVGAIVIRSTAGRLTLCCIAKRDTRPAIVAWVTDTLVDRSWENT